MSDLLLDSLMSGIEGGPRRIVIHGTPAIGKSTFASMAPKPVFIQTEDGLRDLDVTKFPIAKTYGEAMQAAWELSKKDHGFQTVVVDSIDWLEKLFCEQVMRDDGTAKSLNDVGGGFGKGASRVASMWSDFLAVIDECVERGMHVIFISHTGIEKFEPPDSQPYDRYVLKLNKHTWPVINEWASEVLFATYKIYTAAEEAGFGKKRSRGIGTGERVLKTTERPSHVAKNRLGLPDEMPLDWTAFASYLKG